MSIHGEQAEKYADEKKVQLLKGTWKTHTNPHQNLKIPGAAANRETQTNMAFSRLVLQEEACVFEADTSEGPN